MTTEYEGWITHDGTGLPNIGPDIPILAKLPSGRLKCDFAHNLPWHSRSTRGVRQNHVIAYQILVPKHELDSAQARIAELEAIIMTRHTNVSGNWSEDSSHENGRYMNTCTTCKHQFMGHKRRIRCKNCAKIAELEAEITKTRQEAYNEGVEAAAQLAERSFYQECCGNFDVSYAENGEPIGLNGCCGNPDVLPMAAHEIAPEIRALKKEDS